MSPPTERTLLRLAIAKGLLHWEDLDAVADQLPEPATDGEGDPASGGWVRALVDAGYLTAESVGLLAAELAERSDDLTPDLTLGARPWPAAFRSGPAGEGPSFPPELRFLADWQRYRVESLLGTGGMGTVYRAFDPTLGRRVALKFLHRNDAAQTARFLREARAQARVTHPNVCQIHEVGEVEGRPYIAMQYIAGRSLGEVNEELSPAAKVKLVRDVSWAVHAAHRTGLIHRDLKPGNILLARDDSGEIHPFVVDFGLALEQDEPALSRTGVISGTPAYISPEQAQGHALDRRTDVYSLGIVLYELLAGRPPFAGGNPARVLVQLVQDDPRPLRQLDPTIAPDLETVVAKCLEKDPARRYESARELALDLDRFLDGEPIQARPAGWLYRTGKRLRKHRALALVSAAAVLSLAVLATFSLRAQWLARQRAELAQRFGQRIGMLEAGLAFEAALPPHDITPYKRRLREEMESIGAEMGRLGPLAAGPGHYALGQGCLALRQYESARDHLEQAWEAGERGPAVAEALGLAYGTSYERTIADAEGSPTASERQARQEEADRTYRRPALAYLRRALAASPGSARLAGLIAFYERRPGAALEAARRARRQDPTAFEPDRLEAKVQRALASEAAQAGRYDEARRLFARAAEAFRRLASRLPSDPGLYTDECECRVRRIQAAMAGEDVDRGQALEALAACDLALRVDPGMTEALLVKANLVWRLGDQRRKRGEDPTPEIATAVRWMASAVGLEPRNARAYHHLASAHQVLAQWQMGKGLDAGAEIRRSIQAAARAVEVQPELASAHAGLGTAHLVLVLDQQRRGADPRQTLARAVASYHQATDLNPRSIPALLGLGNTWKVLAEVQMAKGIDPAAAAGHAVSALERAAALNPNSATIRNSLGNVHLTLGEYLLTRGNDPRAALIRAARNYQRSLDLKPDYSLARFNLGYTYRSLAEAFLEQGQDPQPALGAAGAALDEAQRLNPTDADVLLEKARADLVAARWKQSHRQDASSDLRAAETSLRGAEALNPEQPDVFFTQALVDRYRAAAAAGAHRRGEALRAGAGHVRRALAINAGEARYLALLGLLEAEGVRDETNPTRRRQRARQAVASLEQALRANPLLQREYGPALAEARLEAGVGVATSPPPLF